MSKMKYIQPQMAIEPMEPETFIMIPPSPGAGENPAPARRNVAPLVPGETI